MSDVRQCPFCELRFAERWELRAHLDGDHPGQITDRDRSRERDAVTVEEPDLDDPRPL